MASQSADSADHRLKTPSSKNNVGKVPRKIHKAAREKLKRASMNELFSDLGKTLDVDHQNNGKASMLRETIRLLGELATQMDSLKKENATLLSEYNYITAEKNELVEEASGLDAQVKGLKREIDERAICSNAHVSQPSTTQLPEGHVAMPLVGHASEAAAPVVGPVLVVPLHHEPQLQGFPNPFPGMDGAKVPSGVSKPRPRYPSSSDSWPSHILTK
ncbi:transcription factor bHLH47-like isoform X4 [Salvia hispanica]|uniref:transcription factor bHLH47-like isoform X4 n=1 Tax=Salvia hispanica TaxID=49212 RepID=UPI002009103D|nr:transcription factor bHLH47-like isoform X4 [Salvia hispanica]XP_047952876.1 transcription factor bHLH47-like isoform X4 [Salvia hispanica]